jgi:hypothetical protein
MPVHKIAAAVGMPVPQSGYVSLFYVEAIRQIEEMARGMLLPHEPMPTLGFESAKVYARLQGPRSADFLGKQLDDWYGAYKEWLPWPKLDGILQQERSLFICFRNSGLSIPAEIKEIYDRDWERHTQQQATRRRAR